MSNGLQQRIIGALVLGALGLVVLPIVFDFADPLKIDRQSRLPAAPEIKPIDVARAQSPEGDVKLGAIDSLFNIAESQPSVDVSEGFYGLTPMTCHVPGCYKLAVLKPEIKPKG